MTATKTRPRRSTRKVANVQSAVRVAVYSRKSVDKGDGGEFGSIDAQREAVEAYILSQRANGWRAIATAYEDLGISGATTDRPAFTRLLADIEAGLVDAVAVYRLDRLSRTQRDLFNLLDLFDRHDVIFVSITEHFDTASPMGRFALGILGQVAQLEREVTAERVRDKVRASRKRGMWTGGRPVLGYDPIDKRLVVNEDEAARVRAIFQLYLDLGSDGAVAQELGTRRWTTKDWINRKGKRVRGRPINKSTLERMLSNTLYVGKVEVDGELYDGQHDAIVPQQLWDAVQAQRHAHGHKQRRPTTTKSKALLAGLVRCAVCDSAMSPHFAAKGGKRHHYYVCGRVQKNGARACPGSRIAAAKLDALVVKQIKAIGRDPSLVRDTIQATTSELAKRTPDLAKSLAAHARQRTKLDDERQNLLDAITEGGSRAPSLLERLETVEDDIASLDAKTAETQAEVDALRDKVLDEEDLVAALGTFTPIWDELFQAERQRILRLLIEEIRFDGPERKAVFDLSAGGLSVLADEAREVAA